MTTRLFQGHRLVRFHLLSRFQLLLCSAFLLTIYFLFFAFVSFSTKLNGSNRTHINSLATKPFSASFSIHCIFLGNANSLVFKRSLAAVLLNGRTRAWPCRSELARGGENASDDAAQSHQELPERHVLLAHRHHQGAGVVFDEDAGDAVAARRVVYRPLL